MAAVLCVCTILSVTSACVSLMEPKIVGGEKTNIFAFPHSAALTIKCAQDDSVGYWTCGSSVVNQILLLTAAHCMAACSSFSYIHASVGHYNKKTGDTYSAYSFIIHENYQEGSTKNDIGLIKLKIELTLSLKVGRVSLMKQPPYDEKAQIAGWGRISEIKQVSGDYLKFTDQYVLSKSECKRRVYGMPVGTICASSGTDTDYPSVGDSGSALVVRGYIQIGLVSYKKPNERNIIVYTDIGYFYDWINDTAYMLVCGITNEEDTKIF